VRFTSEIPREPTRPPRADRLVAPVTRRRTGSGAEGDQQPRHWRSASQIPASVATRQPTTVSPRYASAGASAATSSSLVRVDAHAENVV
jgi:hypothetical protein